MAKTQRERDLNRLYSAAIAFGKSWRQPVATLADSKLADRDLGYRRALAETVSSARARIEEYVLAEYEAGADPDHIGSWTREQQRVASRWIRTEFPWMRWWVRRGALSQAWYYAWHG